MFGEEAKDLFLLSRKLFEQLHIQQRIGKLLKRLHGQTEAAAIKLQITGTLKSVMTEASTVEFEDRFGVGLSPAPLRAVAVNAAKALMELYPIKHVHETRLKIENGEGGVVFNVIVPEMKKSHETED